MRVTDSNKYSIAGIVPSGNEPLPPCRCRTSKRTLGSLAKAGCRDFVGWRHAAVCSKWPRRSWPRFDATASRRCHWVPATRILKHFVGCCFEGGRRARDGAGRWFFFVSYGREPGWLFGSHWTHLPPCSPITLEMRWLCCYLRPVFTGAWRGSCR